MKSATPARSRLAVRLALGCLLLAGVVIRLPHLTDPPLEFHPTRQYRSALLARGYAIDNLRGFSTPERRAARDFAVQMRPLEPPVFERAAAFLYRMAGREALWMPRLLGVLAWTGGAAAMWWLVAPTMGPLAGLAAVAVFLFLPFGVPASQAFQPDSLMTALIVSGWAASCWRHRDPSARATSVLTLVAAAAIFIKPMAVFFVVPVELARSISRDGWLRGARRTAVWAAVLALPVAAWYVYVASTAPGGLEDRFFPELLTRAVFWTDWFRMIGRVITWPMLALSMLGVLVAFLVARRTAADSTRWALVAAWMGYLAFGLLFTHHIHTHDYYSLPLIALAGWSTAILAFGASVVVPRGLRAAPYVIMVLVAMSVGLAWQARPYPPDPNVAAEVARYERIGQLVGHSLNVVSLDDNYGYPLGYHGRFVASNLLLSISTAVSALAGRVDPSFELFLASAKGEFFVATSQAEFEAQPGLRAFFDQRYPVLDRDGTPEHWHFVVYDLRHTRMSLTPERLSAFARVGAPVASRASAVLWAEPDARWRAVVSAPALLDVTPAEGAGPATLTIVPRAGTTAAYQSVDIAIYGEGQAIASATINVRVGTIPAGPPTPPFGHVDIPPDPVLANRDPVVFQGWALDDLSIRRVWVAFRDRAGTLVPLGDAAWVGARPDVAAAHPNAHDVFRSAWAVTLNPDAIRAQAQPVTLVFYAEDDDGLRSELGRRTVSVRQ